MSRGLVPRLQHFQSGCHAKGNAGSEAIRKPAALKIGGDVAYGTHVSRQLKGYCLAEVTPNTAYVGVWISLLQCDLVSASMMLFMHSLT